MADIVDDDEYFEIVDYTVRNTHRALDSPVNYCAKERGCWSGRIIYNYEMTG